MKKLYIHILHYGRDILHSRQSMRALCSSIKRYVPGRRCARWPFWPTRILVVVLAAVNWVPPCKYSKKLARLVSDIILASVVTGGGGVHGAGKQGHFGIRLLSFAATTPPPCQLHQVQFHPWAVHRWMLGHGIFLENSHTERYRLDDETRETQVNNSNWVGREQSNIMINEDFSVWF